MSSKEDKNPGEITCVQIDLPHEETKRVDKSNYGSAHASKRKRDSHTSKYAKLNKEKRDEIIFWCEITIFCLGVTSCILSLSVPSLKRTSLRGLVMWQWCLLITALLGGPVLSKAISNLILFCINREFSAKENIIYYVVGLVESAWVVLWFGMILLAWTWVVDEPSYLGVPQQNKEKVLRIFASTEHDITLTLITFLLGSFLWLVKDLLIMIAKSSFHVRRFFDRIRDSLILEYRIKTLTGHGRNPSQEGNLPRKVLSCVGENNIICKTKKQNEVDLSSLEAVDQESVSCWTMKILINEIIKERPLVYMVGETKTNIDGEEDSIEAANIIFSNLGISAYKADQDNGSRIEWKKLIENQLSRYFDSNEEVQEVRRWLLEGADITKIKKVDEEIFRKCVIRAWKYRRALIRALQDNKALFRELNKFVDVVLVIVIFIVWLVMLNVEVRRAMVVVGSAIVGSAFVFGDFCKKVLDDFTFVFVAHPFDVGDCCLIEGTPVTIERISLLTTRTFTLDDEMKFYPNSVLCNLSISNYTRSPPHMGDSVVFSLHIGTRKDKIAQLKTKIESYIYENSHYWRPEHDLVMEFDLQDSTKMKATLRVKHTLNYHDYNERQARKSQLISEIQEYFNILNLVSN